MDSFQSLNECNLRLREGLDKCVGVVVGVLGVGVGVGVAGVVVVVATVGRIRGIVRRRARRARVGIGRSGYSGRIGSDRSRHRRAGRRDHLLLLLLLRLLLLLSAAAVVGLLLAVVGAAGVRWRRGRRGCRRSATRRRLSC